MLQCLLPRHEILRGEREERGELVHSTKGFAAAAAVATELNERIPRVSAKGSFRPVHLWLNFATP